MKKNIGAAAFLGATLAACGGGGPSSVASSQVPPVKNSAPTADAGTTQFMYLGPITLNGAFSKDPEGSKLTYKWNLVSRPAGSQATLSDPALASPSFVADVPGVYQASLIVNDGQLDSSPSSVTVNAAIETTWNVSSTVDALTNAPIQTLSLGAFSIICFGNSNTIIYSTGDNVTASGYIAYKVGSDPVVYETWNEAPSSGYTLLRAGGFNMALVQKLYQDTDFTFQYSAYSAGLQTSTMKSKNMYVAIEKTRAVCKWPTDIFPIRNY